MRAEQKVSAQQRLILKLSPGSTNDEAEVAKLRLRYEREHSVLRLHS